MLETVLRNSMNVLDQTLRQDTPALRMRDRGTVTYVGQGIARVQGLPGCRSEELIEFPGGVMGMAINLDADEIGVVLLGDNVDLRAGAAAKGSGRLTETPVGENLLGRVIDATGRVLDDGPALQPADYWPIERDAPAIIERAAVSVPLQTGIKVIDALVPVGRGQRELILGDRQTGKTSIAVDTIINQREQNIICIYCAVGQRGTAVAQIVDELRERGAMAYCIVVVASGEDTPGLQFITPYAATSMAEYFMQQGRDVLIVYDDLTRHARAYREISLLLRRPPGREAYPGDIFYVHSRLLERATHLSAEWGGGSLTALPIAETQAQDLSAYIPTNLISITDGQIYVSPTLFGKGQLPAVDVGRSVSRVGGASQLPAYWHVTGDLRLSYSQFEELETFSRFATRLDAATRRTIEHGRRIRAVLKQQEHDTLAVGAQIVILNAVVQSLFDDLETALLTVAEKRLRDAAADQLAALCLRIEAGQELNEDDWNTITAASRRALASLTGTEIDSDGNA